MKSNLRKPGAFLLILLLTSMVALPLANAHLSAGNFVTVCGRVVNPVGWTVEGIHVRVVGVGSSSANDNIHVPGDAGDRAHHLVTDATGAFSFRVRSSDEHELLLNDTRDATDPARNGAAYAPHRWSFTATNGNTRPLDGCDDAGIELGDITMPAPGQGFILATVKDGATAGQPALGHVDVSATLALDPRDAERPEPETADPFLYHYSLHAHTDETGAARLACQAAQEPASYVLAFSKPHHVDAARTLPCRAGQLSAVDVTMWRRPVVLTVTVHNETDVSDLSPVDVPEHKAGRPSPFQGALVRVATTPAGLVSLAPGSPACGEPLDTARHPLVSSTNASPYVCANVTDAAGDATLRLPWAEPEHVIAATGAGHLAGVVSTTLRPWDPQTGHHALSGDAGRAGVAQAAITLRRPVFEVTHVVTNATGVPLQGVAVTLANDTTTVSGTVTDKDGKFTLTLGAGPYRIGLNKSGYNDRACAADVHGATGKLSNLTRADCFSLTTAGQVVVETRFVDKFTGRGIPNLGICSNVVCTTTLTGERAGVMRMELPPETSFTLRVSAGQAWLPSATPESGTSSADADGHGTVPQANLDRALTTTTFAVYDSLNAVGGVPTYLQGANVETRRNGGLVAGSAGVTGADGKLVKSLPWSNHTGMPEFDLNPAYVALVTVHKFNGLHYALENASHSFSVVHGEPGTVMVEMQEEGHRDTAVEFFDIHTLRPVTDGNVRAIAENPPNTNGLTCPDAYCHRNVTKGLKLYADHRYKVCPDVPGYLATDVNCKTNVAPGDVVRIGLNRTPVAVDVRVRDAHTDHAMGGITVAATYSGDFAEFKCNIPAPSSPPNTPPTYVCSVFAADGTGVAKLKLPWISATEQLCLRTAADATAAVYVIPQGSVPAGQETGVKFQAAATCPALSHAQTSATFDLRALRAPIVGAFSGTVKSAAGSDLAGASVKPLPERHNFVCMPAAHDAAYPAPFTGCAGVDASAGAFSMVLPMGTAANHTWAFEATAPGHFTETYVNVTAPGALPRFTLWPTAFVADVTVRDTDLFGASHACEGPEPVYVVLRELVHADDATRDWTGIAAAREDGTCVAEVAIGAWTRGTRPTPSAASPWRKDSSPFAIQVVAPGHVGATVAPLGPLARAAAVEARHLPERAQPLAGGRIEGNVTDADARHAKTLAGAQVVAVCVAGPCTGPAQREFRAVADAEGAYVLVVPLAGRYQVRAEHAPTLYEAAPHANVTLGLTVNDAANGRDPAPVVFADFALARTHGRLTVDVRELDIAGIHAVPGASVDPLGADTLADPAAATTDAEGRVTFTLPWGAYTLSIAGPARHTVLTPTLAAAVQPDAETAATAYTFRP